MFGINTTSDISKLLYVISRVDSQSRKFYTGRLLPEVQPLTLLCIFSDEKGPPFLITSVKSCYPFHEPSLQLCAPLSYNLPMHCL